VEPLAETIMPASLDEAQIAPVPGQGRWCAQQVMEHLILTYQMTSQSVGAQLKSGRVPKKPRSLLEFALRIQTIGLGYIPPGLSALHSVRPTEYTPEAGPAIAARFLQAAASMDALLVAARKKFGIQACGEHPLFGVMRVDEWRRYHAIHASHHLPQLVYAVRYAQSLKPA
jgi:hypothetical protein